MKNVVCVSLVILLALCLLGCALEGYGAPVVQVTPPAEATKEQKPTPEPTPLSDAEGMEACPALRISAALEEGCAVIAGRDDEWASEPVYVYLYADKPVYDIVVSDLIERDEATGPLETGISLYVPELTAGQAVKILDPYPMHDETGEKYCTRITYTNHAGVLQAVLVAGDKEEENPSLTPEELSIPDKKYDEELTNYFVRDDFKEKMLAGAFDDYVPNGMCIAAGSLGDVNGDGIQDALLCLTSAAPRVESSSGLMPLFVLIGRPRGGYVVHTRNAQALFTPYRSASYPVAGEGYIDLVFDYTGGAACHHTYVSRFWYDAAKDDWLLKEFSYQPSYDENYSEPLSPAFVRALPGFADKPLEASTSSEFYAAYDGLEYGWEGFDATAILAAYDWGTSRCLYTIAVNFDKANGYYEGYIHKYYESIEAGGFIQTIRGAYVEGSDLAITVGEEGTSFVVQGDVWVLNEYDQDAFFLK